MEVDHAVHRRKVSGFPRRTHTENLSGIHPNRRRYGTVEIIFFRTSSRFWAKKSAFEGSEAKEAISQQELRKHVAASQTLDEGHTSALESTLSLDQKVSETEAKQEVFLGFTSKESNS